MNFDMSDPNFTIIFTKMMREIVKQELNNLKYDSHTVGVVTSTPVSSTCNVKINNEGNEVTGVKIREGLILNAGDEVYLQFINSKSSNFFIDTKKASMYWYKDLVFPLVQKLTGVGNPTFTAFNGNLVKAQFAVNDVLSLEASEFVHEWKEGTECEIHVHWTSMTNVNALRYVKWEIEYSYVASKTLNQWIAPVTVSAEEIIPENTPALTEFFTHIATFTPTGGKIGGQIVMRLKRIAASGTAPATNPFVTQVGVHLICDAVGSRAISSK